MIDLLLADDHPFMLEGLVRYLSRQPDMRVLGTAGDFDSVLQQLDELKPQVLVLDMHMPGLRGVGMVKTLVEAHPKLGVVVFTMNDEDELAIQLLQYGVAAYLNKARSPQQLAEAIRAANAGRRYITPEIADKMLSLGPDGGRLHSSFSPRERAVFDLLVRGVPSKRIAKELGVAASTVHTYVERIKIKLDKDSIAELVTYAHRHGLVGERGPGFEGPA